MKYDSSSADKMKFDFFHLKMNGTHNTEDCEKPEMKSVVEH
jgi:hypothetical protein